MTDEENYYIDLRGILVVRGVLTPDQIASDINTIDHFEEQISTRSVDEGGLARGSAALSGARGRRELGCMLVWPAPHRQPFRELLVHPIVISRLNEMCGRGFRLEHGPHYVGGVRGTAGLTMHGAGEPHRGYVAYHHQNGNSYCAGVTVSWSLSDAGPGDRGFGGFACVVGSHKSRFTMPSDVCTVDDDNGCRRAAGGAGGRCAVLRG